LAAIIFLVYIDRIAIETYTITLPNIEGVTFDVGPGEHTVAYGDSFAFSLTLADGIDPANVGSTREIVK